MSNQAKKIEAYLDCVSPYSFYAFSYLQKNKETLNSLGVAIEFIPVFLGGINVGSGNKPPWTLPAKAAYSSFDGQRAQKYFGLEFKIPDFFPILSLLPQRCMVYVKKNNPEKLEEFMQACFESLWFEHSDLSNVDNMTAATLKVFNQQQTASILKGAASPEIKQALNGVTKHAVQDLGAFGCPWFWVHDGKGNVEPFFGSDRFHFMWDYLELPHQDLELRFPAKGKL